MDHSDRDCRRPAGQAELANYGYATFQTFTALWVDDRAVNSVCNDSVTPRDGVAVTRSPSQQEVSAPPTAHGMTAMPHSTTGTPSSGAAGSDADLIPTYAGARSTRPRPRWRSCTGGTCRQCRRTRAAASGTGTAEPDLVGVPPCAASRSGRQRPRGRLAPVPADHGSPHCLRLVADGPPERTRPDEPPVPSRTPSQHGSAPLALLYWSQDSDDRTRLPIAPTGRCMDICVRGAVSRQPDAAVGTGCPARRPGGNDPQPRDRHVPYPHRLGDGRCSRPSATCRLQLHRGYGPLGVLPARRRTGRLRAEGFQRASSSPG